MNKEELEKKLLEIDYIKTKEYRKIDENKKKEKLELIALYIEKSCLKQGDIIKDKYLGDIGKIQRIKICSEKHPYFYYECVKLTKKLNPAKKNNRLIIYHDREILLNSTKNPMGLNEFRQTKNLESTNEHKTVKRLPKCR